MDTIAAVCTAPGRSAIGILRLSGEGAIAVAERVFRPKSGRRMGEQSPGRLVYGALLDREGEVLDLCLCTVSRAPHSYTGEDTAELQVHGSPVVLAEGLRALFAAGARQAKAGEFTKRAFLNGKLDLTGAEAVIDLIDAESPAAARNAAGQLGGAILQRAEAVYQSLLGISAHFAAEVDFPEDDIEPFALESYRDTLAAAEESLRKLLGTYERGRYLREGVPIALVGKPNAGKSSLLNALVGYERAIVTAQAGTTRDTVEERLLLGGVTLRLTDTAGLRETTDEAERLGVRRAEGAARAAALVVGVFDGAADWTAEDGRTLALLEEAGEAVALVNKADLPQRLRADFPCPVFAVSAKTGAGLEAWGDWLREKFASGQRPDGSILTSARQADALTRAVEAMAAAREAMATGLTPDAVLTTLEDATAALSELLGRQAREDMVESIFHRFCVGK